MNNGFGILAGANGVTIRHPHNRPYPTALPRPGILQVTTRASRYAGARQLIRVRIRSYYHVGRHVFRRAHYTGVLDMYHGVHGTYAIYHVFSS